MKSAANPAAGGGRRIACISTFPSAQRSSRGLSPLSTHDTKRSEDVRARLNVLSEIPRNGRARQPLDAVESSHKVEIEDGVTTPTRMKSI